MKRSTSGELPPAKHVGRPEPDVGRSWTEFMGWMNSHRGVFLFEQMPRDVINLIGSMCCDIDTKENRKDDAEFVLLMQSSQLSVREMAYAMEIPISLILQSGNVPRVVADADAGSRLAFPILRNLCAFSRMRPALLECGLVPAIEKMFQTDMDSALDLIVSFTGIDQYRYRSTYPFTFFDGTAALGATGVPRACWSHFVLNSHHFWSSWCELVIPISKWINCEAFVPLVDEMRIAWETFWTYQHTFQVNDASFEALSHFAHVCTTKGHSLDAKRLAELVVKHANQSNWTAIVPHKPVDSFKLMFVHRDVALAILQNREIMAKIAKSSWYASTTLMMCLAQVGGADAFSLNYGVFVDFLCQHIIRDSKSTFAHGMCQLDASTGVGQVLCHPKVVAATKRGIAWNPHSDIMRLVVDKINESLRDTRAALDE